MAKWRRSARTHLKRLALRTVLGTCWYFVLAVIIYIEVYCERQNVCGNTLVCRRSLSHTQRSARQGTMRKRSPFLSHASPSFGPFSSFIQSNLFIKSSPITKKPLAASSQTDPGFDLGMLEITSQIFICKPYLTFSLMRIKRVQMFWACGTYSRCLIKRFPLLTIHLHMLPDYPSLRTAPIAALYSCLTTAYAGRAKFLSTYTLFPLIISVANIYLFSVHVCLL